MFLLLQGYGLVGEQTIEKNDINLKSYSQFDTKISSLPFDEIIDQNQTSNCGESIKLQNSTYYYAQQFRPQINMLTKISLILSKKGSFTEHQELTVSLRKYLHVDKRLIIVDLELLDEEASWIEFDFSYCNLDINEMYYIVVHLTNASETDFVEWYFDYNNPYERGKPYYSKNDENWKEFQPGISFPDLDFCFQIKGFFNNQPEIPIKPDGPTKGQYGKEYPYTTQSSDNDTDMLWYKWSWGDGTESDWCGPYNSGNVCEESNIWMIKGSYLVKVKAKDEWNFETDWSEALTIKMDKTKGISSFFLWLRQWFDQFDTSL